MQSRKGLTKKMRRMEVRWLGKPCFASLFLPPDIHAEHKYHSLTVMCHLNADGWDTQAQGHVLTHNKTQRDNLKTDLLGSYDGWLSLTHTRLHASRSYTRRSLELRCHTSVVQMKIFPRAGNLWWLYDSSDAHQHSSEETTDKRMTRGSETQQAKRGLALSLK